MLATPAAYGLLLIFTVRHHEKVSKPRGYLIKIAFHFIANASREIPHKVQEVFIGQ